MRKIGILFIAVLSIGNAFGQQKIGNNPTSINSNAVLELESTDKGLLIPRVALSSTSSASPLSAFVAGMMVYNTATAGDVTPGFYVSSGSSWSKIDNQTSTTLYNGNGSLSGNRTVTQGTNTLAFTSSATSGTSHFTVDGTTFNVDAVNNRIGIGTATPTQTLDVAGTARFDGGATISLFTNGSWINLPTTGPSGIGSGGAGANAWIGYAQSSGQWFNNAAAGDIAYRNTAGKLLWGNNSTAAAMALTSDRLGIGNIAPTERLDVTGNVKFSGALMPNNTAGTSGQVLTSAGAGAAPTWTTIASNTGSTSVILNAGSFERAALTGDVTAAQNSNALTIANDAVTSSKILDGAVGTADIAAAAVTKAKLESNISIPGLEGMTLPGGTTAQRPASPTAGMIRYNSTLGKTEVYQGGTWVTIDAASFTASNGLTLSGGDVKLGGTLTAATTTIDMGTNKMAFNSTASSGAGHFNIDGSTFSVDAALNRVGIGTQTPGFTLDVTGTLRVTSTTNLATTALNNSPLYLRSDANHGLVYNGTADGPRLFGFGGGFLGTQNGTNALFWNSNGNVGVGNSAPSEKLDVTGNVRFSGALMPNNTAGTAGQVLTSAGAGAAPTWTTPASATNLYNTDGSLTGSRTVSQGTNNLAFTSTATTGTSHFTVDGTTFNVNAVNNRIGLGIAAPIDLLHLEAQGGRKIVISNNGGINNNEDIGGITWRDGDGTGTLMGNIIVQGNSGSTVDGSSRMVIGTRSNDNSTSIVETMTIHSNGNVGINIGSTVPSERLHVVGNIRSSSLAGSGSRMVVADANGVMSTQAIPTSTTYTGSTSVALNGTSFERAALTGDVTATQNSNALTIANNAVSDAKFRQSAGVSVVGRSANSTGNVADITAAADNRVLKRSGGSLTFAQINDADVADVNWSKVTSRPTTLAGYGITDAASSTSSIQNQVATPQTAGFNINGAGTLLSATLTGTSGNNVLRFENGSNFQGKNSAGTYEFFLTPRGGDNVTYMNFGSAGLNIRNNSDASRLFIQNGGNVGIGSTSPTQLLTMASTTNGTTIRLSQRTPNSSGTTMFNVLGNDPNDGSYLSWNNTLPLRFSSATDDGGGGWVERMRINGTNGNVGIGTTNPGATLNVIHPTANTTPTKPTGNWAAIIENNQDAIDSRHGLSVVTRWGNGESKIFEAASYWNGSTQTYTPVLTVLGTRNVGIGTANPSERLEVAGNVRFSGALMPNNSAGTSGQVLTSAGAGAPPTWTTPSSSTNIYNTDGSLTGSRTVSQGTNTLAFTSTATTGTSHFTVDGTTLNVDANNNRVGIGTNSPSFPLHVVSTGADAVRFEGSSNATGVAGASTLILVNTNNTNNNYSSITSRNSSLGYASSIEFLNQSSGASGAIRFVTNNNGSIAERLRIVPNGNVGIGTDAPTVRLDVDGGILARGNSAISNQGLNLQWNRSGTDGESWILNQKGGGTTSSGIRFGGVTTANVHTEWARFVENGNFGINQVNPQARLHVGGNGIVDGLMSVYGSASIGAQGLHFAWNRSGGQGESWIINQRGLGSGSIRFGTSDQSNNVTELARIENNGNFGIGRNDPSHPLHMGSGAHVTTAGNWTNASDLRLKKNIENSRYGLSDVLKLRPVDYQMKSNNEKQVGFIAQEVKKVIPEVVSGDENSDIMMGISYGNLVPVLVNAIKEQQAQIEKMQKEIEELKKDKK